MIDGVVAEVQQKRVTEKVITQARKAVQEFPLPQTARERAERFKAHYETGSRRVLTWQQFQDVLQVETHAQAIADGVCTIINGFPDKGPDGVDAYRRQWMLESVVHVLQSRI